jgi:phosphoglycerate dehydrogenase-like enzyme
MRCCVVTIRFEGLGVRVLIAEADHLCYRQLLQQALPQLGLVSASQSAALAAFAQDCPVWLGDPQLLTELLRAGGRPQWIQSTWAGITPLLAEDLPRDYRLTRAVGVFGQLMAEYVLCHLLGHERGSSARLPGSLAGRRVLLVGCGDIGLAVARFLRPFGVHLLGVVRRARALAPFEQVASLEQLPGLVAQADYVINLLPDTAATRDVYDAALFACFKPSAVLINVGRGTAIVDRDLVAALEQGRLAAAVIDVCREEPLAVGHPFWTANNLSLTGHSAAPTLPHLLIELFIDNLQRFQQGMALRATVDFSQGY